MGAFCHLGLLRFRCLPFLALGSLLSPLFGDLDLGKLSALILGHRHSLLVEVACAYSLLHIPLVLVLGVHRPLMAGQHVHLDLEVFGLARIEVVEDHVMCASDDPHSRIVRQCGHVLDLIVVLHLPSDAVLIEQVSHALWKSEAFGVALRAEDPMVSVLIWEIKGSIVRGLFAEDMAREADAYPDVHATRTSRGQSIDERHEVGDVVVRSSSSNRSS